MVYAIEEHNICRLESKLKRIQRKCQRNGNDFVYRRVGEETRDCHQFYGKLGCPAKSSGKFILVEVEGIARVNGYEFVAELEVHEGGNLIRRAKGTAELPERFRHSSNYCEHCYTTRSRSKLYVVRRGDEYKQVGSDCLMEYTGGMDAEYVAAWLDGISELEKLDGAFPTGNRHTMLPVDRILAYAAELIDKMGYFGAGSPLTTCSLLTMMLCDEPLEQRTANVNAALARRHFSLRFEPDDFLRPGTEARVAAIIKHYSGLEDSSEFVHNARILLADGYAEPRNFGILSYLPEGYNRWQGIKKEVAKRESIPHSREYFGEEGRRYTDLPLGSAQLLATYDTMYSPMYIYRLTLKDGYNLIWKTSVRVAEATLDAARRVSFIVKAHNEYRGCPQTEITRARLAA